MEDRSDLQKLLDIGKEVDRHRPRVSLVNNNKEIETGTGIGVGGGSRDDFIISYDFSTGEQKNFKPKPISTFDMQSNDSRFKKQEKTNLKAKPV